MHYVVYIFMLWGLLSITANASEVSEFDFSPFIVKINTTIENMPGKYRNEILYNDHWHRQAIEWLVHDPELAKRLSTISNDLIDHIDTEQNMPPHFRKDLYKYRRELSHPSVSQEEKPTWIAHDTHDTSLEIPIDTPHKGPLAYLEFSRSLNKHNKRITGPDIHIEFLTFINSVYHLYELSAGNFYVLRRPAQLDEEPILEDVQPGHPFFEVCAFLYKAPYFRTLLVQRRFRYVQEIKDLRKQ